MSEIKLAIGLRVYEETREALALKMRFLEKIPWNVVSKVFVAVNAEKDKSGALEYFNVVLADPRVEAFPVQPWFKIGIPALNAMTHKATAEGFSHLWFVSTRLVLNEEIAQKLMEQFEPSTLVVGALMPGHFFSGAGLISCDGETCPYNSCAIWALNFLHKTGFLPVSEMSTNPEMAGNEETVIVALQQRLFGNQAKLVSVPGIHSQTNHWDNEREERHQSLVDTKKARSQAQLDMFPVAPDPVYILHVI